MYRRYEPSEQVFVDREEHLEWMDNALKRCKDRAVVLQLSGIGGIGKSSLLDYWNRTIESTIRLDCRQYSGFYSRLNILAKGAVLLGIKLPRFDVLWQIRLRFVEGLEPVKEEGREWAKEVLTAIPFIGSLANIGGAIGAISAKVTPKLKGRYGELASWLQDRLGSNHVEKLLEILWKDPSHAQFLFVDALAEDLSSRKELNEPVLLLLDHFEHVDNESRNWRYGGKKITEAELWCVFLSSLRNSVGVLATRRAIAASPHDDVDVECVELLELDEISCTELLNEQGVNEEELQKRIVSVSGGNPFVIDAICDILETRDVSIDDVDCLQADTLEEVRLKTWRRLFSQAEGLHEIVNHAGLVPYFSKDVMNLILPSMTSDQWDRLRKLSFVREQSDGTCVLHELAKELVVSELGNRLEELAKEVADRLEKVSEKKSDLSLLGMAISVLSLLSTDEAISKLRKSVDELFDAGRIKEAAQLLDATAFETDLGQMVVRGLRGRVFRHTDRFAEAEIELRTSIEYFQSLERPMTSNYKDFIADCFRQLGSILWSLLHQSNAKQALLESISIRRELVEQDGPEYLEGLGESLLGLAWLLMYVTPNEAEPLVIEAIDTIRRIEGKENTSCILLLARAYGYLGLIHGNLFKWDEEETALRSSLEITQTLLSLSPENPNVLARMYAACNNLGYTMRLRGHYAEARELLKQARHYLREAAALQPDVWKSTFVFSSLALGFLSLQTRKLVLAESYFREAISIVEEQPQDVTSSWFGPQGYALSGLALVLLESDEIPQSLKLVDKAVGMRRDVMELVPWGQGFGYALNAAGVIYSKAKKESAAKDAFKEAIEVLEGTKMDPQEIPLHLASCKNNYGVLLLHLGRLSEAVEKLREAVQIHRRYLKLAAALHPGWVAEILTNLAVAEKRNGNLDESEKLLKEALDFESRLIEIAPESYHYHRENTLRIYSSLLQEKSDEEGAETLLKESQSLLQKFSELGMTPSKLRMDSDEEARFLVIN